MYSTSVLLLIRAWAASCRVRVFSCAPYPTHLNSNTPPPAIQRLTAQAAEKLKEALSSAMLTYLEKA